MVKIKISVLVGIKRHVIQKGVPAEAVGEANGQAFEKYNIGVKLANPLKTKAIAEAKIKTDTLDARTLAHLLRSDLSFFTISIP